MIIYQITNIVTNDFYIGKTKDLNKRQRQHFELAKRSKALIHRAINKYGKENFVFSILEEGIETDDIDQKEVEWIARLKPRYNLTQGGDGGDTSNSPGYQVGMANRRSYAGEANPNYGKSPCRGQKRTEEQKLTLKEALKSSWKNNETRRQALSQKMQENNPGMANAKKILYEGVEYKSLTEAVRQTGRSREYLRKKGSFIS